MMLQRISRQQLMELFASDMQVMTVIAVWLNEPKVTGILVAERKEPKKEVKGAEPTQIIHRTIVKMGPTLTYKKPDDAHGKFVEDKLDRRKGKMYFTQFMIK